MPVPCDLLHEMQAKGAKTRSRYPVHRRGMGCATVVKMGRLTYKNMKGFREGRVSFHEKENGFSQGHSSLRNRNEHKGEVENGI